MNPRALRSSILALPPAIALSLLAGGQAIAQPAPASPVAPLLTSESIENSDQALAFLTGLMRPVTKEEYIRLEKMLRASMAAEPADPRWPTALTLMSRFNPRMPDAEQMARTIVEIAPGSADSWYALGVYLAATGSRTPSMEQVERTKAAIQSINHALALDPMHAGALEMATEFYSTTPEAAGGSRTRAIDLTDQMMAIPDIRWRGAELRARICMIGEDWEGVDLWFERGVGWAPTDAIARDLHMQRALLYLNFARDPEKALAIAMPFAQDGKADADRFSFVVGQAAYRLGDYETARVHYQRVIDAGDPPPNAILDLADCLRRADELEAAAEMIEYFLERFPGHPKERDVKLTLNSIRTLIEAKRAESAEPDPPSPE